MKIKKSLLLLAFLMMSERPVCAQTITPDFVDVEYARVNGVSLKLDIYLPKNVAKPYPVVVWIHGGRWLGGSKEEATAAFMAQTGYAVVSINYRFSDQALFPAQIYDCKAAIRWIRANAAKYGFEAQRIGAWGSSAGGHLAALLGVTSDVDSLEGRVGGNLQYSSRVQAVCDWFGPTNFLTLGNYPSDIDHNSPTSPEALLIGGAIPANPAKARAASPITYVSKGDAPFLIMHGTLDMSIPFQQSVEMDSVLRAAGVVANFKSVIGAGHGADRFSADSTHQTVTAFFDRHLKTLTSVNNRDETTKNFQLYQNYPNPFNPSTTIRFFLPHREQGTLKIFDALGKEIATLTTGEFAEGEQAVVFEATALSGGVYFYRLVTPTVTITKPMEILK